MRQLIPAFSSTSGMVSHFREDPWYTYPGSGIWPGLPVFGSRSGQHLRLTGSESSSVQLMPAARFSGLKLEPDQNIMRLGSVPVATEQWYASEMVKDSASAY